MILEAGAEAAPAAVVRRDLPSNSAWPAENNVNIVALGLRDNTSTIINAYRDTRAKHGFDPDGT